MIKLIRDCAANGIEIFGDANWRGDCPLEDADTITICNHIRQAHGGRFEKSVLHVMNEKHRKDKADFRQLLAERKKGAIITGWSDVCVTGWPTLFMEVKRKDLSLSKLPQVEIDFLVANQNNDAWVFVVPGWEAGIACFENWYQQNYCNPT